MAEESYSFTTARTRLEEIVTQVRKKDTSLEKSLDLLEEGVRLANACTEQIDQADWATARPTADSADGAQEESSDAVSAGLSKTLTIEDTVIIEDTEIIDRDGTVVGEVVQAVEYETVREFVDADDAWPEDFAEDALEPTDPSVEER